MSVIPARLGQSGTPFRFAPRAIGRGRLWLALALAALADTRMRVRLVAAVQALDHHRAAGLGNAFGGRQKLGPPQQTLDL